MILLFFLLLVNSLFATLSTPLTLDIGEGYREDHLKLHLLLPNPAGGTWYEERYDPIRFAQTEVTLRFVERDIYLLFNGGYSAIGKCTMKQGPLSVPFSTNEASFHFHTTGQSAHAMGIFGYQVDLTPCRHYTVAFTPLFGYGYYYEKLKRKMPTPNPFSSPVSSGSPSFFNMFSKLSRKNLTTIWKGFFVGADVQVNPGGIVTFNATYAYHFMALRQKIAIQTHTELFSPTILLEDFTTLWDTNVHTPNNHGHLGILKAYFDISCHWGALLYGKILYFTSHMRDVTLKQTVNGFSTTSTTSYKMTHLMLEILVEGSYKF